MVMILAALGAIALAAQPAEQPMSLASEADARSALLAYGKCLVARQPDLAHRTLTLDFRSDDYRQGLRKLREVDEGCLDRWVNQQGERKVRLRAEGLPYAAALAEALLSRGTQSLNVRLARAAATEAPTYAPTDRVAMCIARSDPDGTARMFGATVGSASEEQAIRALAPVAARCAEGLARLSLSPQGLRAMVATASYRLLAAAEKDK